MATDINKNEDLNLSSNNSQNIDDPESLNISEQKSKKSSINSNASDKEDRNAEDFNCKSVLEEFIKIKNCSILKYGVKRSVEKIKFGYCRTCDSNLVTPICLECLKQCHQNLDHDIREINEPDFIICGCGERMHKFIKIERKNCFRISGECPYSDWCEKSGLSSLYIIADKCVCEFCYQMCGYDGKGTPLEKEKEMLQVCECEKLNGAFTHTDLKRTFITLEDILDSKDEKLQKMNPDKFLNLLFLGKGSYENVFSNFEETMQKFLELSPQNPLVITDNFSSSNFYLSLRVFSQTLSRNPDLPLRYYSKEIVDKFSFTLISNVLNYTIFKDNKTYYEFLKQLLLLYKKINLGYYTMPMGKYKLKDLENYCPLLRKCITSANTTLFKEAHTQIEFFINFLKSFINHEIYLLDAYDIIVELVSIFRRFSCFYLFNNIQMTGFCFSLEKLFNFFKSQKSYSKQLKIYHSLTTIFLDFIYNYNDTFIVNYILDKKKDTNTSNVKFIFCKNELGRLITRCTIRMMYNIFILKTQIRLTRGEKSYCSRTISMCSKILCLMFTEKDNYYMNYLARNKYPEYLLNVLNIKENNSKYIKICEEITHMENSYLSYYSFNYDNKDVIREVNDSLNKVLGMVKNYDMRPYILKSNFMFILCKSLYIINFEEDEETDETESIRNFLINLILFLSHFVEENDSNALIICSHYIINGLIKLPDTYIVDIFKLYAKCAEVIQRNRGFISDCNFIIFALFEMLVNYKNNSKDKWSKEAQDFLGDDVNLLDQVIFLFLSIIIKLVLQNKVLYPILSNKKVKKILIDFLTEFEYGELINYNECLVLILVNKIFDSNNVKDREILMKLIPIQKIVISLEDTNIEIDFRTEILIFLKKYKCALFFKQQEEIRKKIDSSEINPPSDKNNNNQDKVDEIRTTETKKKEKNRKNKKKNLAKISSPAVEQLTDMNICDLFKINNQEKMEKNDYLNPIGQDGDNFKYIKNNPLISNYKYPIKYLTFYYYFLKNEDVDHNFKVAEAAIELFEKELRRFKDIFEKNTNYPNKMLKYYVKGIVLPICPIIKLVFCYTNDCNGYNILMLYQIIIKMLYIKNFIIDMNNSFLSEKLFVHFENFDIDNFLSRDNIEVDLEDYFALKEKHKFSPFDFTHLWEIFNKHFLSYIHYPESLNLEEKYPLREPDYIYYGKITEEADIINGVNFNMRKKGGNSIIRKNFNKSGKTNNFILPSEQNTETKNSKKNLRTQTTVEDNNNGDNIKEEKLDKELISKRINKIFEFYSEEKINLKENNSSLLVSLPELCSEYETSFRRMLLCLLVNLREEGAEYNLLSEEIINKLLSITTAKTQQDIINNFGGKNNKELGFLINISNSIYINMIKSFVDDFNLDFCNYKNIHKAIFSDIKLLKLLCEEHNNYFQEKILCSLDYLFTKLGECKMISTNKSKFINRSSQDLIMPGNKYESMSFFNFMINCLHKILIITKKCHVPGHIDFFYDIFFAIIELLVEIIQGNKKEILTKSKIDDSKNSMSLFTFKTFVSVVSEVLFDDSLIHGHAFRARLLLISFFIAILEEKNNEEIQKIIMKFLTINKVLESITFTMKNYFYEHTKNSQEYREYYSNFSEKKIMQREFIFDYTVYSYFKHIYYYSDVSKESKEFELANNYYKYIKKLCISGKSPETEDLIKQIDKLSENEAKKKFSLFDKKVVKPSEIAPINLINEKEKSISISFIEHYYIIKFFESITKVVEVRLPQEHRNANVIFTVPCEMIHLSEMTKSEFVYNVDRSGETSKKFELVRSISLFQLEIEYFKNTKLSFLSKFILKLDFIYVQIIIYLIATVFLILMLFTMEGYKGLEPIIEEEDDRRRRRLLRNLIFIPEKFTDAIDACIDEWGLIYDYICYGFCALDGFLIVAWIFVKVPLYYILDKFKYLEENKLKEEDLSLWNKFYIAVVDTIYGRDYINTLLYMFIISLIGAIMERGEIVYAFLLLAILDLNSTLKGIGSSIKLRAPDLGSSFLLFIFMIYFYSNIGFFYLNDDFAANIENDIPDNYCLCLAFCFMTNFDAGVRARGGAADQMVRISFERHTSRYIYRLIYDVTYFLICIIIMIDLVFGIILGTFSDMREAERKHDNDKENHCFLCHITREIIEKKKEEDFKLHREKKHYLWTYVEYMIYLKFENLHDLNASNSFARINLDNKNISFLPSCQDDFDEDEKSEEEKEKEEEEKEEEEEEEESEENSESYYTGGTDNNDDFGGENTLSNFNSADGALINVEENNKDENNVLSD